MKNHTLATFANCLVVLHCANAPNEKSQKLMFLEIIKYFVNYKKD